MISKEKASEGPTIIMSVISNTWPILLVVILLQMFAALIIWLLVRLRKLFAWGFHRFQGRIQLPR